MITKQILDTADRLSGKTAINIDGSAITYRQFATSIRSATRYFSDLGFYGSGVAVIASGRLGAFWTWSLALRRLGLTIISVQSTQELKALELSNIKYVITSVADDWPGLADCCRERGLDLHEVEPSRIKKVVSDAHPSFHGGGQILKTSGTTGSLKKILVDPQSEDMYTDERAGLLGLTEDIVCNIFRMSPWTGVGYKVPINVWAKGGCIIMSGEAPMHQTLQVSGATHAILTPSILDQILAAPENSFPRQTDMVLFVTAGALSSAQINEARRRLTPLMFNMLATTENGIFGFTPFKESEDPRWHRPLPGSKVEVVDENDRPVAPGCTGYLRVSNPTEARYHEEAEANRLFFRDGFFYPGDLAELDDDGRIALQGRSTDVINIRGSKLSPAFLESRLSKLCAAREICIFAMPDADGEERVFCLVEGVEPVNEAELASIIGTTLSVKDPIIRYVEIMPRTESGKVMRYQLRKALT